MKKLLCSLMLCQLSLFLLSFNITAQEMNFNIISDFELTLPEMEINPYQIMPLSKDEIDKKLIMERLNVTQDIPFEIAKDKSLYLNGEYNVNGVIREFRRGALLGSGAQENLIGLGTVNTGTFAYLHKFNDRLSVTTHITAVKFNSPYSINQTLETGVSLAYRVADRIAFNAFGNYTIGNSYYAVGDIYNNTNFGGYFSFDMSERFGIALGAQHHYYQSVNMWETDPIIMPYFKINDTPIGIDVGGIIKSLIKGAIDKNSKSGNGPTMMNGTIMPPKMNIPVRPRL